MKYIIANWKANSTYQDINVWMDEFSNNDFTSVHDVEIILCPPFPFLTQVKEYVDDMPFVKIGSQDISQFSEGAYTGEITASMLQKIIDYAIIGHSERRSHFNETNELLEIKSQQAIQHDIKPILCVRNTMDLIPHNVNIVAYEPVESIGTGNNQSVEMVISVKHSLNIPPGTLFIYGGSVDETNAALYLNNSEIDGVLVGSASLDPKKFYDIIRAVNS